MSTKLRISVTKDILEHTKYCSITDAVTHCAIAVAVRDIFPHAKVTSLFIYPQGNTNYTEDFQEMRKRRINLPDKATSFIEHFDAFSPEQRVNLPEISFEVDVPDSVVDEIDIEEIKTILHNHPTLELV